MTRRRRAGSDPVPLARLALVLALACAALVGPRCAEAAKIPIVFRADHLRYDKATDSFIARGNVEVSYRGIRLACDFAQIHRKKKRIFAKGRVIILRGGIVSRSEAALVDVASMTLLLERGRILIRRSIPDDKLKLALKKRDLKTLARDGQTLARIEGKRFRKLDERRYQIEGNGRYTSCVCREKRPDWSVTTKRATITWNEHVTLRDASFCVLDQPIPFLRFPWLRLPIGERRSGFLLPTVTVDGRDGLQVGLVYYWAPTQSFDAAFGLTFSQDRGVIESVATRWQIDAESFLNASVRHLVDLEESRTNRFELKLDHALTMRYTRFFASLHLLSDHVLLNDLENDYLKRATPYTKSLAVVHSELEFLSVGLAVELYQDLLIEPTVRPIVPRDLFREKQKEVVHRLPEAWLFGDLRVGPLRLELDTRYSAFAPLGRPFLDVGSDGIKLAGGLVDNDGTEANRHLDPNEPILQAHRFAITPRADLLLDLWGAAHLRLNALFDYRLLATRAEPSLRSQRLLVALGADLSTEIWRIYAGRFRHYIEPRISYRIVPWQVELGDHDRLPRYEPADFRKRVQRLGVGVETGLIERTTLQFPRTTAGFKQWFALGVRQEFDFDLEDAGPKLGHLVIRGEIAPPLFNLKATAAIRWQNPGLSELDLTATFTGPRGNSMMFSIARLNTDPKSQYFRDDAFSMDFRGIQRPPSSLGKVTVITAGPTLRLVPQFTLFHRIAYSVEDNRLLQTETGMILTSSCNCWTLSALVRTQFNVSTPSVMLTFTLKGLGG